MVLAEGYRWNVPTIYYAFDRSFLEYFGEQGIRDIEKAIKILNDLPRASEITDDGSSLFVRGRRVPTNTKRVNFQAQALGILDLKSFALNMIVEELGLAAPERFVWTLRSRTVTGNGTITNYVVVNRNFDPITLRPSRFVNGVNYSYLIEDFTGTPANYADAVELPVGQPPFPFSSVAGARQANAVIIISVGGFFIGSAGLSWGEFFTGLTHDDVGGLRYLLRNNNFAVETTIPTATLGRGSAGLSPWIPFNGLTNLFGVLPVIPGLTNVTGTNITNWVVTAVRPGVEKLSFRRANYDSLIGTTFITVTNTWTDRYISNGVSRTQTLQRVLNQPDFLFSVGNLGLVANLIPVLTARSTTTNWINNSALNSTIASGGPGVITPQVTIFFSNELPFFENQSPFLDETSAFLGSGIWGSFDATTNAPILYPQSGDWTLERLLEEFRRR